MASGKTPVFDWEKGEFKYDAQGRVLTVEDSQALEQVILKIHATPRGRFLLYADPDNPDLNHKYGSDVVEIAIRKDISDDVRESEIQRAVRDALIFDPWVIDVTDIKVYQVDVGGVVTTYADYTLVTKFDDEQKVKGAVVNG